MLVAHNAAQLGPAQPPGLSELDALLKNEPMIAFVGGGGKTSSMFALARLRARKGERVLVSTTTRIFDPDTRTEREGRGFGTILAMREIGSPRSLKLLGAAGPRVVLGSIREDGKLRGVDPDALCDIARLFDCVLVEADGARGLPIKAPADYEPVIPRSASAVVGLVGLDALGSPMDGGTVHRPELFGPLTLCAAGEPIAPVHVARLVSSPEGLFKGTPVGARKIVVLNKADAADAGLAADCASAIAATGAADAVLIAAIGALGDTESRGGEA
jgi:probable selenium-dependent hydroxylase accessory protein YqeC